MRTRALWRVSMVRIEPFSIRSWALEADSAIHPPSASCSGSRRSGSNPLWKSLSTFLVVRGLSLYW